MNYKKTITILGITTLWGLGVSISSHASTTNQYGYYQAQKTVKVPLYGTTQSVKIKKNTIVPGYIFQDAFRSQKSIKLNLSALSYQYRKAWPKISKSTNWQQSGATEQAAAFKAVTAPKQMLIKSVGSLPLTGMFYVGNQANSMRTTTLKSRLVLTTDGYLERYYDTYPNVSQKPVAAVKINQVQTKGLTTYLFYANHVKGVKDKRVAKTGKLQYRLTVKNLQKTTQTKFKNADVASESYTIYSFGGQHYFTLTNQVDF